MKQLVVKIVVDLGKDLDEEQLAEIESDVLDYLGNHDIIKWADDKRSGAEMSAAAKMREVAE